MKKTIMKKLNSPAVLIVALVGSFTIGVGIVHAACANSMPSKTDDQYACTACSDGTTTSGGTSCVHHEAEINAYCKCNTGTSCDKGTTMSYHKKRTTWDGPEAECWGGTCTNGNETHDNDSTELENNQSACAG